MRLATISVLLLLLAAVINAMPTNDDDAAWQAYKLKYRKNYADAKEESSRRGIRSLKLQLIEKHNEEAAQGLHSYTLAENHFADQTPLEYQQLLKYRVKAGNNYRVRRQASQPLMPVYTNTVGVSSLPVTVNWTASGWVGPVMDQGQCGSCWAYSAAGAIEAQYKNHTGTFVQLSEQNLIDCSTAQGNAGCDGGDMNAAFWYVQTNGIQSLATYPDVSDVSGVSDQACAFNSANSVTTVKSWRSVAEFNELALQQAVALSGPVSVAIDASLLSFQMYGGGVYNPAGCSTTALDHGMLVVGYGVVNAQPYWLIKNSWSTSWGINGYMMMARNANNMCGIATAASFPVIG